MYIPKHFREDDPSVLHDLIEQYNFAALVTHHDDQLHATHLPFYLDKSRGEHGTLVAHMARANSQWRDFADNQEALVIFQGPHAYITPSWYENVPTNVPTWNMAVVHAYGIPKIIEDHDAMYAMLRRLVSAHESPREQPWPIESSEEYVHGRIAAIVGFELPIARLEGKFKLSQNRTEADQLRVIDGLGASGSPQDAEVASLMEQRRPATE
ncbi:MAG: FMN-binding negative transcriptional regulator [Aggregatilineales bacterium]